MLSLIKKHVNLDVRKGSSLAFGAALVGKDDAQSFGSALFFKTSAASCRLLSDMLEQVAVFAYVPWTQEGATNGRFRILLLLRS